MTQGLPSDPADTPYMLAVRMIREIPPLDEMAEMTPPERVSHELCVALLEHRRIEAERIAQLEYLLAKAKEGFQANRESVDSWYGDAIEEWAREKIAAQTTKKRSRHFECEAGKVQLRKLPDTVTVDDMDAFALWESNQSTSYRSWNVRMIVSKLSLEEMQELRQHIPDTLWLRYFKAKMSVAKRPLIKYCKDHEVPPGIHYHVGRDRLTLTHEETGEEA